MIKGRYALLIVVLIVVALFCIAASILQCVTVSLEAEKTLHANQVVLEVLEVYMRENPDRWPQSWEQLSKVNISNDQHWMFSWPEDIEKLRKRVSINFDLTRAQVADMRPEWFSALKPFPPYFPLDEHRIESFIEVARNEAPSPPGQVPRKER
jgi:type II secretory pathway pseudopilin PulG